MKRRNFLSGLLSVPLFRRLLCLPLFRSILRPIWGEKAFSRQITDREEAGLRGLVKTCVEETTYNTGKSSRTTEYGLDGRLLATRASNPDCSEWVTTQTYDVEGRLLTKRFTSPGFSDLVISRSYDAAGRLVQIRSGRAEEPPTVTLYTYDEKGRVEEVRCTSGEQPVKREGVMVAMDLSTDPPTDEIHVGAGGRVTAHYDDAGQSTELKWFDSQGRLVARSFRTYDANGRIIEESGSLENPAQWFLDEMTAEQRAMINDKHLEAINQGMKLMMRGRKGTGVSYSYDALGRVAEVRRRDVVFEVVTTVSYNEHGDKSEEVVTYAPNYAAAGFSVNGDGTLIPDYPGGVSNLPPVPEQPFQNTMTEFRYEYDQNGNWTERTTTHRMQPVDGPESGGSSTVDRRTLTYF